MLEERATHLVDVPQRRPRAAAVDGSFKLRLLVWQSETDEHVRHVPCSRKWKTALRDLRRTGPPGGEGHR